MKQILRGDIDEYMKLMCCIVLEITKGENIENRDYREK